MPSLVTFVTHHWPLWVALLVVLIMIFLNEVILQKKRPPMLSTASAIKQINDDDAVILDIRPVAEFNKGHIVNAVHVEVESFDLKHVNKDKPLIVVCNRGISAVPFAEKLRNNGASNVMVLEGGMTSWVGASLPVVKGKK